MTKPKIQIIVLFQNLGEERAYYARSPAPPLSGILLAGLTPDCVDVEVLHEMVRPIDYDTDADCIALSFMDFCAPHAYEVAARFRAHGKVVIAGGKYPSTFPDLVAPHVDCVVVGESETLWPCVVRDLVEGSLRPRYEAPLAPSLVGMPAPRYDLVEPCFSVPIVTEATRGCPFSCTYCQLTIRDAPFRTRPIDDVIRDLSSTDGLSLPRRKMAMLYDNNFGGDMAYAKDLLQEIARLDLWGVGYQFSFNCLRDDEFLDLLSDAHAAMAFIGMESLNQSSLRSVRKGHNRVEQYRSQFAKLRERGILIFTGFMLALDEDTPEYYRSVPKRLEEVDPSAVLISLSIPIPGTPFHAEVESEGRIVDDDLSHYEGDHLVFEPRSVGRDQVFDAFEEINRRFYSWASILRRWIRFQITYLARGGRFGQSIGVRFLRSALLAAIYYKLSSFQRHHAREKVLGRPSRLESGGNRASGANPTQSRLFRRS
ncbi:MAG: B12-binding domain-containing radical SAM protein [marine benthic group bacterium]|nr:B12-binding domain-containing radical SAM protein [Gemmatimonadota bacterium]